MSSADSISDTILNASEASSQPLFGNTVSSNSSSTWFASFVSYFQNINWTTWLVIILLLAFLGFNIFAYLAKGTQNITNIFGPALKKLFGITIGVTGDIINTSAQGAKTVVNTSADVIDTTLTGIQTITPSLSGTSISNQQSQTSQPNSLNQTLNDAATNNENRNNDGSYEPNQATSSVNYSGSGKAGWCFIGSDRGFNSCAQVGVNDTCVSGEIFPSKEICVNPNLRS